MAVQSSGGTTESTEGNASDPTKKDLGESKEKTLTRLTQTGESFSLDLKGSEAVHKSIHCGLDPQ